MDYSQHLAACRKATAREATALALCERTWPDLPIRLAENRGHTVVFDGIRRERWTCTNCGRAVVREGAVIYGSATTEHCDATPATEARINA